MALLGFDDDEDDVSYEENIAAEFNERYRLLEIIGQGGFGKVHKCRDRSTKEIYAVKIIISRKLSRHEQDDIKHEITICAKLHHPHIVKFICSIEDEIHHYLVFELITGGELFEDIVRRVSYTEKDAAHYIQQILEAMIYVHSVGVIHRDLKPENLLLARQTLDSEIKITDFGLAIETEDDDMHWYGFAGSILYMSPELVSFNPYNKQVDLWSIGVIMYVMLIGYPPFWSPSEERMFSMIKSGDYYVLSVEWRALTHEAKDLIARMLTVDPTKRITAVEALKHDWVQRRHDVATDHHRHDTIGHLRLFNVQHKKKGGLLTRLPATSSETTTTDNQERKEVQRRRSGVVAHYLRAVRNFFNRVTTFCVIS